MLDVNESYLSQLLKRLKVSPEQRDLLLRKYTEELAITQSFEDLNDAIEESRQRILTLKEDWDGDGGKPYQEETWKRATTFIRKLSEKLWLDVGLKLPVPKICPGPGGSIDVHWKSQKYELLINVPENADEPADVYGDNYKELVIKGTFEILELIGVIAEWLKTYL